MKYTNFINAVLGGQPERLTDPGARADAMGMNIADLSEAPETTATYLYPSGGYIDAIGPDGWADMGGRFWLLIERSEYVCERLETAELILADWACLEYAPHKEKARDEYMTSIEAALCADFERYCLEQNIPAMSADEIGLCLNLSAVQRRDINHFISRWNAFLGTNADGVPDFTEAYYPTPAAPRPYNV